MAINIHNFHIKVLSSSNQHAKYSFDAGDGNTTVFFNPDSPIKAQNDLRVFDMAFGATNGPGEFDVNRNIAGAAEILKKFIASHKPDMVVFHTTERPSEIAAAMSIHAESIDGYIGFKYVIDAMASFAFLNMKSDRSRLQDYLDDTEALPIEKAQKL